MKPVIYKILLIISYILLQGCTTREDNLYDEVLSKGICEVFNAKFVDSTRDGTKQTYIECSNGLILKMKLTPKDGIKL